MPDPQDSDPNQDPAVSPDSTQGAASTAAGAAGFTGDTGTTADAPRKRPKPGERRVQILHALASMLEQPGAERVTTSSLAARLGVSEAALYRHFASKAQMFEGLIEFIEQSIFGLVNQLAERERAASGAANTTDVVMLEAHLLGIEEMDACYMASVEFSGLIREDASAGPNPFREVWNITRPKTGSDGWLVAGVQALQ